MRRTIFLTIALTGLFLAALSRAPAQESDKAAEEFMTNYWKFSSTPQGKPPKSFSPLESALDPPSCANCHPAQYNDWKTSLHARTTGPGVVGQWVDDPSVAQGCVGCHAPLAEQQPYRVTASGSVVKNENYVPGLEEKGLICAACHVRRHTRFGPPKSGKPLGPSAEKSPHGGVTRIGAFERSAFCRECHQHPASAAVNGKPIQNTYVEWKEGPYSKLGVQCQDCHMPARKHLWKGIHDPEMTARAVTLGVVVPRGKEAIPGRAVARISLTNSGAGHMFPTYMVPVVFIKAELLDKDGKTIEGSRRLDRIQRRLEFDNGWVERSDTRIPPKKTRVFEYNVPNPRGAKRLRVSVEVHPDYFYGTSFFPSLLEGQMSAKARGMIKKARDHAMSTPYVLYDRTLLLP